MKRPSNKILLILSLFLIFLVMGTASAVDDDSISTNDTLTVDDDAVSDDIVSTDTSDNTEELYDSVSAESDTLGADNTQKTFYDLNNELKGTSNVVKLEGEYKFRSPYDDSFLNGTIVSRNMVIDGQDKTVIDGSGLARIFNVDPGVTNFTLKNIIIKNMEGIVSMEANPNNNILISGTFENCSTIVLNLYNQFDGVGNIIMDGKYYNFYATGDITHLVDLSNAVETDNIIIRGEYVNFTTGCLVRASGSAIVKGNIDIDGTFKNLRSYYRGVIIHYNMGTTIAGNIKINGYYENCSAVDGTILYFRGLSDTNANITILGTYNDCNLYGNRTVTAANSGGTFTFYNGYKGDMFVNATFKNISVRDNGGVFQFSYGSLTSSSNVVIYGDFINCSATGNGGIIRTRYHILDKSNITIRGNFIGNSVLGSGGIVCIGGTLEENSTLDIKANFINNTAVNGGVIYIGVANGNVYIDGNFTGNNVSNNGGVINTGNINGNVDIKGNYDNNSAKNGGVINTGTISGEVSLDGNFTNNNATNGGVANFGAVTGNVTLNGTYENNNAVDGGVANFNGNVNGKVTVDGTYTNNSATNAVIKAPSLSNFEVSPTTNFTGNVGGDIGSTTSITATLSSKDIYSIQLLDINVKLNNVEDYNGATILLYLSEVNGTDNRVVTIRIDNETGEGEVIIRDFNNGTYTLDFVYEGNTTLGYLASRTSQTLHVKSSEGILTFKDLNKTINNNTDNTVYLDGIFFYNGAQDGSELAEGIVISRNIVIDGQNKTTIDGNKLARIFKVSDNVTSFVLKNIVLQDGKAATGGAVYFGDNVNNIIINNCNFTSNSATSDGGALYFNSDVENITINNCIFSTNTAAINGGAIAANGNVNNMNINSTFTSNVATKTNGGVLYAAKLVENSHITGNFTSNRAGNTGSGSSGHGGALYLQQANNVDITGYFKGNYVRARDNCYGGAIFVNGIMNNTDIDAVFDSNYARGRGNSHERSGYGGAIFFNNNLINTNIYGTFVNNYVYTGGANSAYSVYGGAIFFKPITNVLINSTFDANYAKSGGSTSSSLGGVLYFANNVVDNLTLQSTFVNNYVYSTSNVARGIIYFDGTVRNSLINSIFTNNNITTAKNDGSGLLYFTRVVESTNITGIFNNNTIKNNFIHMGNTVNNVKISDIDFVDNVLTDGYIIYITKGSNNIIDNVSSNTNNFIYIGSSGIVKNINVSEIEGIALNIKGDNVCVYNLTANDCANLAIEVNGKNDNLTNVNVATSTGNIITLNGDNAYLTNINLTENEGVGILVKGKNNAIHNSIITKNSGTIGVGVLINGPDTKINNVTFTENNGVMGVGIYINSTNAYITNSTLKDNTATVSAKNIAITDNAQMSEDDINKLNYHNNNTIDDVPALVPEMNVKINPVENTVHDNVNVTVTITDKSAVVTILLPDFGYSNTTAAVDGIATVTVYNVPVGNHTVIVKYIPSTGYANIPDFTGNIIVKNYSLSKLQELINETIAKGEHKLTLKDDFVYEAGDNMINIPENFTIDGNNHFIDAKGSLDIFNISNNVTIENIKLNNANKAISGTGNDVAISNVDIANSVSGIEITGNNTKIINTDVVDGKGVAITVTGDKCSVENTNIDNNAGNGIVINGNNATVDNIDVTNTNGTAISITGANATVTAIGVANNNGTGIVVSGQNSTVDNVNVTNSIGTAISLTKAANTKVSNINITGNAGNGLSVNGANATVANIDVSNSNGTAVSVTGVNAALSNIDVTGNNGIGVYVNGRNATLDNASVSDSIGKAIIVSGGNNNVTNINITKNKGDGLSVTGVSAIVNNINVTGSEGTAIKINSIDSKINNLDVTDNIGKAVDVIGINASLNDVVVDNNTGDAVSVNGIDSKLDTITVTNSVGTAVTVDGDGVNADKITVKYNEGSAMKLVGSNSTVNHSNFINNTGTDNVGLFVDGNDNLIANSVFANNTGDTGTGIALNGTDNRIINCTFDNNNATYGASDIAITDDAELSDEEIEKLKEDNPTADISRISVISIEIIKPDNIIYTYDDITVVINVKSGSKNAKVNVTISGYYDGVIFVANNGTIIIKLNNVPFGETSIKAYYVPTALYKESKASTSFNAKNYTVEEFKNLIEEAITNNKTSVDLPHSVIFGNNDTAINVTANFTINGNNHIVDANGHDAAFTITGDNAEINNLTIINVKDGVAINSVANNTKLSDITLTNNTGTGIKVVGDNSVIDDIVANNHIGDIISVIGNNANITDITANQGEGTGITVAGEGANIDNLTFNEYTGVAVKDNSNNKTIGDVIINGGNVDPGDATNAVLNIVLKHTPENIVVGDNVTFVVSGPRGNFNVTVDGQLVNVINNTFTLTNVTAGLHNVTVTYNGKESNFTFFVDPTPTPSTAKSFADLQKLIDEAIANNQTSITLTDDYAYHDGDKLINVPANFTINGDGHIINAKGTAGVFNITGDNAAINNLTIINVKDGVAIYAKANNTSLSDITLTNNTGKGILVEGDNATITGVVTNDHEGDSITAIGDNATIKDSTINGGNGIGVKVVGDNYAVDGTVGNNHNGTLVEINGNNNIITNSTANGGNGTIVDVHGNNNTIDGVNSTNHTGDLYNLNNSTNSSVKNISPGDADIAFDLSKANADPAIFTINLPKDATGIFTVSIGGKNYTAPIVNGTATISVPGLSGSQSVVLSYSGDDKYSSLFKTATITVNPKPTAEDTVIVAKKKITFKKNKRNKNKSIAVTLKTKAGKVLAGQKVYFKLDKKILKKIKAKGKGKKAKKAKKLLKNLKKGKYAVTTKANGKATLKLKKSMFKFKKGKGKLTASFQGAGNYKASSISVKIVMK